jgi:hypothetical protein
MWLVSGRAVFARRMQCSWGRECGISVAGSAFLSFKVSTCQSFKGSRKKHSWILPAQTMYVAQRRALKAVNHDFLCVLRGFSLRTQRLKALAV